MWTNRVKTLRMAVPGTVIEGYTGLESGAGA